MTKAAPDTPAVSVMSKENADALIAEATGLRLNLSPSLARELIHAAHEYAQAHDRDEPLPDMPETIKEFERVERVLRKAAAILGDMKLLAIQRLAQDRNFPARGPVIKKLDQMRDAAGAHRRRLLANRNQIKGPVPQDPHILKLARIAKGIYQRAGGTGVGAWRDTYGNRGHAGRLIKLTEAAFHQGPGKNYFPGNTPIANAVAKLR